MYICFMCNVIKFGWRSTLFGPGAAQSSQHAVPVVAEGHNPHLPHTPPQKPQPQPTPRPREGNRLPTKGTSGSCEIRWFSTDLWSAEVAVVQVIRRRSDVSYKLCAVSLHMPLCAGSNPRMHTIPA